MTYETEENKRMYVYDIFNADGVFFNRVSLGNIQVRYVEGERYVDTPTKVIVKGDYLYRMNPSPLSGQEMPFFKVKFEPAFNDFTVPATVSKKRGSESRYKPRSQFDSC